MITCWNRDKKKKNIHTNNEGKVYAYVSFGRFVKKILDLQRVDHTIRIQKSPLNPPAIVLNDMLYCNNTQ